MLEGGEEKMSVLHVDYKISEELAQKLFAEGQEDRIERTASFSTAELSGQTREVWLRHFGRRTHVVINGYRVKGGHVFDDGSVSDEPPIVSQNIEFFERNPTLLLDKVLQDDSDEDLAYVLALLDFSKTDAEEKCKERFEKWQKAKEAYEHVKKAKNELEAKHAKEVERLENRISELEGYLRKLIQHSTPEALKAAGLVKPAEGGEGEPELTDEQEEALRTTRLSDDSN